MNDPAAPAKSPAELPETLLLVDASSYLFRAYHALPPLATSKGEPSGAIRGVVNMLQKTMRDEQPDYVGIVFDAKGKTFRDDLYPEYKANRPPMPEELRAQIAPIHDFARAMGLPLLIIDGVEADDVIGTLATQARAAGLQTIISTGDKDLAQLVGPRVSLINTMSRTRMDEDGVLEKFGVRPRQIVDYLALVGDSSDNIPGVPKVGPKTAAKWLQTHATLDAIMADADNFPGRIGQNLREALDFLPLARRLATIKTDVALTQTPQSLRAVGADMAALQQLVDRFEFSGGVEQFIRAEPAGAQTATDSGAKHAATDDTATAAPDNDYHTVLTEADFNQWLERLRAAEVFAFDTETDSLDYMKARIVGVSVAVRPAQAAYIPFAHDYPGAPEQLSREWALARLQPLLEDPALAKVGQHIKYDMNVLANHGITLRGARYDTMLESYVLNSIAARHDMDSLAKKYLDLDTTRYQDIAGKGVKQLTFNQIPLAAAAPYAAEDADVTLRLHQIIGARLAREKKLHKVFNEIEMPLVPVLSAMERTGVLIDSALLHKQSGELTERMTALEQYAHGVAGRFFNLDSTKQLQHLLYEEIGLTPTRKTPKGWPSTDEKALQDLVGEHELPRLILQYRGLSKLKSTYTDRLPTQIDAVSGRVHTSYHQAVTATGRLSSTAPNLQNIPIRTEEGRRIRQAFIAPPGHVLAAADYSQIELRIMAHLSEDPGLLGAFQRGEDVHRATAAEVFGIPLAAVDTDQRRAAKAINFGLIYGMSAFGLAEQLQITRGQAQQYIDAYFEKYPGVQAFMERVREQAARDGYVETLFGRRLYLPDINTRVASRRQAVERAAINAPMQGSAADIIKRAMLAVHAWLQQEKPPVKMIMQVHDELVFEIDRAAAAEVTQHINAIMNSAAELSVPLLVECGIGKNWHLAH